MIVLTGADLVLPDRVVAGGTITIEEERIAEVRSESLPPRSGSHSAENGGHSARGRDSAEQSLRFDFPNHYIVPGFIDVHVHGLEGIDTLDGTAAIGAIAERMPRYGVTGFCPTSIACDPPTL